MKPRSTVPISKPRSPQDPNKFTIVHPAIEEYIFDLHRSQDEAVLLEMEARARERGFPIVGRLVGAFLEVMAKSIGAKRIFEFGSGFGYSAYWFSRAVGPERTVICTDGDANNKKLALDYLERVGRKDRIAFHVGWAQDSFKKTTGDFDIIYNDVDKDAYPEVWQLAKDRLRPGGLYICDNVLWGGRVTLDRVTNDVVDGWTEAIKEHNRLVAGDKNFDFFINPTRDGLIVARRKEK